MSPLHFFCSEFAAKAEGFFLHELLISFQLSPGPLAKSFYRSCSICRTDQQTINQTFGACRKQRKKLKECVPYPF